MKLTAVLLIFISCLSVHAAQERQLRELCQKNNGQVTEGKVCPNSGKVRPGLYCELKNQFFNGCTRDFKDWGALFFKACVVHDFCYHNEPGFSGKARVDCDLKFKADMQEICDITEHTYRCYLKAESFYKAVRAGGSSNWDCAKNDFEYINRIDQL